MQFLSSEYYDAPEGHDCFGKMVATNKYAAMIGLGFSTVDVLMVTKPKGYIPIVARYAYNIGPLMGMASAFTLATYASTNIRGKDDKLNYVIGGICAGGVFGAWKRSAALGTTAAIAFSIAGALKKLSKEEGWEFFPPLKTKGYGNLRTVRHDYTLMAERPRNWTTGKD